MFLFYNFFCFLEQKVSFLFFTRFPPTVHKKKQSYRISTRIKLFSHTHLHAQAQNRIANAQTFEMHSCTYPYNQHTQRYVDDTGFNKSMFYVRI